MSKLICIEGIDCSGKTTISKAVSGKLFFTTEDWWITAHEPNFGSAKADSLNFNNMDPWQREFYFMKDRLDHQKFLENNFVILDRYILTGLAYAEVFSSPVVHSMCQSIYILPEFKQPDMIYLLFIDPKLAVKFNETKKGTNEYNSKFTEEIAMDLWNAFLRNLDYLTEMNIPYKIIESKENGIDNAIDEITQDIKQRFYGDNNEQKEL